MIKAPAGRVARPSASARTTARVPTKTQQRLLSHQRLLRPNQKRATVPVVSSPTRTSNLQPQAFSSKQLSSSPSSSCIKINLSPNRFFTTSVIANKTKNVDAPLFDIKELSLSTLAEQDLVAGSENLLRRAVASQNPEELHDIIDSKFISLVFEKNSPALTEQSKELLFKELQKQYEIGRWSKNDKYITHALHAEFPFTVAEYQTIIDLCGKMRSARLIKQVQKALVRHFPEVATTVDILNTLLEAYSQANHLRELLQLWSSMRRKNILNSHSYQHVIRVLSACGHLTKFNETYQEMLQKGYKLSYYTWNHISETLPAWPNGMELAELLYQELLKQGPDRADRYNGMIMAYVKAKNLDKAMNILEEMERKNFFHYRAYFKLRNATKLAGKDDLAATLEEKAVRAGIQLPPFLRTSLPESTQKDQKYPRFSAPQRPPRQYYPGYQLRQDARRAQPRGQPYQPPAKPSLNQFRSDLNTERHTS